MSGKEIQELCRLCAQKISYGFDVFIESEEKASLDILINKYLPIKVIEDDALPKKICEPCHIGMAATVDFLDRLVDGQQRLFNITKEDVPHQRNIKETFVTPEIHSTYGNYDSIPLQIGDPEMRTTFNFPEDQVQDQIECQVNLCSGNPDSTNVLVNIQGDTPDVEMDDLAQGTDTSKVYEQHPLMKTVENITVLKKTAKRKATKPVREDIENCGRPRRRKLKPNRFRDTISGTDLDKLVKVDTKEVGATSDLVRLEEGKSSLNTMSCGNTVIITPNHPEDNLKLPAAVNIELDFSQEDADDPEQANQTLLSSVQYVMNPTEEKTRNTVTRNMFDRRRTKKKKWFCDVCKKGFSYKGRYLLHLKTHSGSTFHCHTCKDEFTTSESLKQHHNESGHVGVGILREEYPAECSECPGKIFSTSLLLAAHQSIHHKTELEKPFPCTHCEKKFTRNQTLKEHIAYFHNNNGDEPLRFFCKQCGKEFKRKASLDYHVGITHQNHASYVCSVCSKDFKAKPALVRHCKLVHSNERPFKCEICDSTFKTNSGLKHHQRTHSQSKQYTCELCGKQFTYRTSLNCHIKAHKGLKDHECPWCSKSFVQKCNLNEHMRIHTGERPFWCKKCSKSFTTSSQLRMHQKKHRERFKCGKCRLSFDTKELLAEHTRQAHSEPIVPPLFTCAQCGQVFKDKRYLRRHMKIHGAPPNDIVSEPDLSKEKTWVVPTLPDPQNGLGGASPNVIYIISKKEDTEFRFNVLEEDNIFPPSSSQIESGLPSMDTVQFTQFDSSLSKATDFTNKVVTVSSFDENFLKNNSLQFVTDDQSAGFVKEMIE